MPLKPPVRTLIFDWGDTVMRDFNLPGPMSHWPRVKWIPGAENILKTVAEKYICIIATNAGHSNTEMMIDALKRVGAQKYFHHFYSSKDLGYEKPDPRFFLTIAKKAETKPSACVMIGNMYDKDISGAKAAGMQTVFFNENKTPGRFPHADAVIHSMNQLLNLIP